MLVFCLFFLFMCDGRFIPDHSNMKPAIKSHVIDVFKHWLIKGRKLSQGLSTSAKCLIVENTKDSI